MIAAHFQAVRALLVAAAPDIPVHDTDASRVVGDPRHYPYLVLSGGGLSPFSESLGGCPDGEAGLIRLTHVATGPTGVRELLDITRPALTGARLDVPGRHGWDLDLDAWQDVDVDREVTLQGPGTSAYPFFAVDIYRLGSTIPGR